VIESTCGSVGVGIVWAAGKPVACDPTRTRRPIGHDGTKNVPFTLSNTTFPTRCWRPTDGAIHGRNDAADAGRAAAQVTAPALAAAPLVQLGLVTT